MNKKMKYLKDKKQCACMKSNNKTIRGQYRGINEFMKGYKRRSNLVNNENGNLFADSNNILNRWKNYFSQLLNVQRISDVNQLEMHTAEPLEPEHSPSEC
jgi:glucose-6-phosphate 1-dehydrogenase